MSSALYDAALCSVDFAQLLPGLFNRDDNQHRTPSPPRRAKDATPHRAPKTTPHDHTATATRSEDTGAGLMARKHAHTNKGKHDGKKAGAKAKSNGATRPPNSSSQPAPPPSTAAGLTAIASPSPSSSSSYPQTFYNDDLSTAPLFPPAFKRTDSRPLPPLDLEDRDLDTRFPAASNSPGSAARDVAGRIHPADRDADGRLSWRSADEEDYSYDSSLSSSLSYSDDDYDEDADEEDSGGGADDEEDLEEEEDDSDERRPFPDPRLAKQQKYLRRSPGDDDKLDVSPPTHVEHAHPPRLDTNLAISHIAAVRSAYATPLDSPLVSPSLVPSHKTSILPVPSNLPSPTYDHPSHSVDEGHYTSLPNSGVERTYVPPSAYTSEVSDSESESDWRGRNRHPRLLWRSKLDPSSLRVLDAHHARVRGGPLPRLVVDEEGRVVLSASGVEREREHAGLEEGEGKERVRRRRGRMDKEGKARSWSVVGRRWSRAVEKCGL
ncbi:hypothetical protein NBRC10512_002337 [Rhodotorula toruloides]|uniref:RHTO0S08e05424g1_1 n=2 Tax=Rhodotorula toruloides TaxID=5286 RepID=A0A061BA29_RHOTO|nr:uncharacterized protein RHTO_01020 [Rhodotorula toruloides NP11]EMS22266.1 hypothetical protein RHTO_01020 [Rhodotorula toruloides NP11]CDR43769.1 RHTO0S08e05424g1_1 [Rhodotorula toruloides]